MKVLLTISQLLRHGGAQSYLQDLAIGLQNLGHEAAIFSGDAQHSPPITDLEKLPFTPDLIYGQHILPAVAAITALPGVPAVYHCHGATWKDSVPRHPRIYRYLTMSRTLAERIAVESCIDPAQIEVVLNSVNLARFRNVRELPPRPSKALVYNSRTPREADTVTAIRQATMRLGLELDFVGYHFDRHENTPENLLPEYDVVFASGISAIEALASGCSVVVLGRTTCGSMVTPDNFDQLRQVNFSASGNLPPASALDIEAELRSYSPRACAQVTGRMRHEADLQSFIRNLERIFSDVIEDHSRQPPDPRAEMAAVSQQLRNLTPLVQMTDAMMEGDWDATIKADTPPELRAQAESIRRDLDFPARP